jgi:LysM repeat protein
MRIPSSQTTQRALIILVFAAILVTVIPVTTIAAPPQQQGSFVYYVRYGDTLYSIAMRYGTTVPAIMQTNGLPNEYIYAGQRLIIPGGPVPPPGPVYGCTYIVQPRDTIYSVAYRYGTQWYTLMRANYLYSPWIFVGQQLRVPCMTPAPTPFPTYTVQPGDNLFRIAIHFNTSIYAIAVVNGIYNPNMVFVGQTLIIPYSGSVTWPTVPTITATPITNTPGAATATITATATVTGTVSGSSSSLSAPSAVVVMTSYTFIPGTLTINRGGTVLWKNQDSVNHAVTSGATGAPTGVFTSGTLTPGQTFSFTFPNAGAFTYFSELDSGMSGTITVQ